MMVRTLGMGMAILLSMPIHATSAQERAVGACPEWRLAEQCQPGRVGKPGSRNLEQLAACINILTLLQNSGCSRRTKTEMSAVRRGLAWLLVLYCKTSLTTQGRVKLASGAQSAAFDVELLADLDTKLKAAEALIEDLQSGTDTDPLRRHTYNSGSLVRLANEVARVRVTFCAMRASNSPGSKIQDFSNCRVRAFVPPGSPSPNIGPTINRLLSKAKRGVRLTKDEVSSLLLLVGTSTLSNDQINGLIEFLRYMADALPKNDDEEFVKIDLLYTALDLANDANLEPSLRVGLVELAGDLLDHASPDWGQIAPQGAAAESNVRVPSIREQIRLDVDSHTTLVRVLLTNAPPTICLEFNQRPMAVFKRADMVAGVLEAKVPQDPLFKISLQAPGYRTFHYPNERAPAPRVIEYEPVSLLELGVHHRLVSPPGVKNLQCKPLDSFVRPPCDGTEFVVQDEGPVYVGDGGTTFDCSGYIDGNFEEKQLQVLPPLRGGVVVAPLTGSNRKLLRVRSNVGNVVAVRLPRSTTQLQMKDTPDGALVLVDRSVDTLDVVFPERRVAHVAVANSNSWALVDVFIEAPDVDPGLAGEVALTAGVARRSGTTVASADMDGQLEPSVLRFSQSLLLALLGSELPPRAGVSWRVRASLDLDEGIVDLARYTAKLLAIGFQVGADVLIPLDGPIYVEIGASVGYFHEALTDLPVLRASAQDGFVLSGGVAVFTPDVRLGLRISSMPALSGDWDIPQHGGGFTEERLNFGVDLGYRIKDFDFRGSGIDIEMGYGVLYVEHSGATDVLSYTHRFTIGAAAYWLPNTWLRLGVRGTLAFVREADPAVLAAELSPESLGQGSFARPLDPGPFELLARISY